jgi:HD-GYP domain-containing protein (c-di-GMP phosphodiesterase class II)
VKIICAERGSHFDPDIVDVFKDNLDVVNRIRMFENFRENPESIDDILLSRKAADA